MSRSPLVSALIHISVLLLIFLPGCSIWDSLTAYFNTFYNAEKLYAEAETELWAQPDVAKYGRDNYLAPFVPSSGVRTKLNTVIEKCSKLLQYHPESNLVDDALLMIGMSYFYQADHQQADRKFRECLARYPDGNLVLRSSLMLTITAYKMERPDTAFALAMRLRELARDEGEDAIEGHAAMVLGRVELVRGNREKAEEYIREAAELGENASLRAVRYLDLADLYERAGEFEKAEGAFRDAARVADNYAWEYRGYFGVARMRKEQEDYSGSLDWLERLRDNFNNREFFPEIELERGVVFYRDGEIEDAMEQYRYVDTAYGRTESAALACLYLGKIYEHEQLIYDSARVAYTRGRPHSINPVTVADLLRRADYLNRYATFSKEIRKLDSLWTFLLNPPPAPPDTASQEAKSPGAPLPATPKLSADSIGNRLAMMEGELATLFYVVMDRADSAAYWYRTVVTDHPKSTEVSRALFALAQIAREDTTQPAATADSLYREVIARFPMTEYANEARRILGMPLERVAHDEAEASYLDAESRMLRGDTTGALDGFRAVAATYPKSPFAARAQYAQGWVYENLTFQPDSALASYQTLVSLYPSSQYVAIVQPKLAEVQQQKSRDTEAQKQVAAAAATAAVDSLKPVQQDTLVAATNEVAPARQVPTQREPGSGRRSRRNPNPSQPAQRDH